VLGPVRSPPRLFGEKRILIEGSFTMSSEFNYPLGGYLQVTSGYQCLHKLPYGAILQVWVHGETPLEISASWKTAPRGCFALHFDQG